MDDRRVTRRLFVAQAAAGILAGCGGGTVTGPEPDRPPEARLPLMAVGVTVPLSLTHQGRFLDLAVTRLDLTRVAAVSRECTHQGCRVGLPVPRAATLDCPCHGSRFGADGALVQGPADRPLTSYPARIEGDEVVVSLA